MRAPSPVDILLFGEFRFDRRIGVLSQRDERGNFAPLTVGSRALDILGALVERPGELVSRSEIISVVWPGSIVEDGNLDVQIAALRRVLDKSRTGGSSIQTIRGRGYRFTAPVTRVPADAAMVEAPARAGDPTRPALRPGSRPGGSLSPRA